MGTLNKKLNLTHPKWAKVSDDAKDLIAKLLVKDPEKRITLEGALKHRWFDKLKTTMNKENDLGLHEEITPIIQGLMSRDREDGSPPPPDTNATVEPNDFELVDTVKKEAAVSAE